MRNSKQSTNNPQKTDNRPFRVCINTSKDENKAYWKEIGAAWPHKNGEGFNLTLFATPLDGKACIFPPSEGNENN